jgi:hypothetical protein
MLLMSKEARGCPRLYAAFDRHGASLVGIAVFVYDLETMGVCVTNSRWKGCWETLWDARMNKRDEDDIADMIVQNAMNSVDFDTKQ